MKKIRYICAQPAIDYYLWQVDVMLNNFIRNEISAEQIHIVCGIPDENIPEGWEKLRNHYNNVEFFFYQDTRPYNQYVSSIRPHLLEKHFNQNKYLETEAIFYHDCDILFSKTPDWTHLLEDDVWYLSDTKNYICAEYVKSKGYGVHERMCEIIGIDKSIPEKYNDTGSGGAQYIMKNVDHRFWKKVYDDSENLYQFFLDHLKAFPQGCLGGYHPIQKWTADMWAVLWNAWNFGHDTKVVPEMNFTWPIHPIDSWEKNVIFHNAGVTRNTYKEDRTFFKADYMAGNFPYNINLDEFSTEKCSYKYVQEILLTAKNTPLN